VVGIEGRAPEFYGAGQNAPGCYVDAFDLARVQSACLAGWMDTRSEQDLIDVDIPDARYHRLIQQKSLDARLAPKYLR